MNTLPLSPKDLYYEPGLTPLDIKIRRDFHGFPYVAGRLGQEREDILDLLLTAPEDWDDIRYTSLLTCKSAFRQDKDQISIDKDLFNYSLLGTEYLVYN